MTLLEAITYLAWGVFVVLTVRDVRRRDRENVSGLAALALFSLPRAIVWIIAVLLAIVLNAAPSAP